MHDTPCGSAAVKPDGVAVRRGRFDLENAFDRFVTQIECESLIPDAVAVACAEATMWACALDELWKRAEGMSYWDRRDADRDGYVMFGLRWARNNHVNQLISIVSGEPVVIVYAGRVTTATVSTDLSVATGRLFKVLADPTRLALVRHLAEGEASVSELVVAVGSPPQSRVSNHLACLRWYGLVTSEKVGRSVIYRLADSRVVPLLDLACEVATPHAEHLATCTRIGPDWV